MLWTEDYDHHSTKGDWTELKAFIINHCTRGAKLQDYTLEQINPQQLLLRNVKRTHPVRGRFFWPEPLSSPDCVGCSCICAGSSAMLLLPSTCCRSIFVSPAMYSVVHAERHRSTIIQGNQKEENVVGALTPAVSTILAHALGGALGKALQNKNQPASVRRIRDESCLVYFF
jgi:hypothetical protein